MKRPLTSHSRANLTFNGTVKTSSSVAEMPALHAQTNQKKPPHLLQKKTNGLSKICSPYEIMDNKLAWLEKRQTDPSISSSISQLSSSSGFISVFNFNPTMRIAFTDPITLKALAKLEIPQLSLFYPTKEEINRITRDEGQQRLICRTARDHTDRVIADVKATCRKLMTKNAQQNQVIEHGTISTPVIPTRIMSRSPQKGQATIPKKHIKKRPTHSGPIVQASQSILMDLSMEIRRV